MEDNNYPFGGENFAEVVVSTLVHIQSLQEAFYQVFIEHFAIESRDKKFFVDKLKRLTDENKDTNLKLLYELFGKTPDTEI